MRAVSKIRNRSTGMLLKTKIQTDIVLKTCSCFGSLHRTPIKMQAFLSALYELEYAASVR
jgi:hypothetical protein